MKEIVRLFLDGSIPRHQESFILSSPKERLRIVAVYLCEQTSSLQLDFSVQHIAPDTHSEIYVYGIIKDSSYKACRLHIDFRRGCAGSTGIEREEALLLSDYAHSESLPTITCQEQDIQGSHGAGIGQIDQQQISYLMSRGLTLSTAKQMLTKAQIYKCLTKISDPHLKKSTQALLDKVEW